MRIFFCFGQKFLVLTILLLCFDLRPNCSFLSSSYIDELKNPEYIEKISVEVPQSAKFTKNFLKIITSKTENIPPNLKKNFYANIKVSYVFGDCAFAAKVKQAGDWRDHIDFKNGQPLMSLNVTLEEGNILNAVKFKLLLPETRGHFNEILGSLIFKSLGFISPETFEVITSINNVESIMIFQEDARKELLEKNLRREGPIFEGDESILWSMEDKENFELENISLSRMVNDNWFQKGESSQFISIFTHAQLQKAYLDFTNSLPDGQLNTYYHFNSLKTQDLQDFHLLMLSMNGKHGLRPHNRRFYFNSFTQAYEPIYYDGDLDFSSRVFESELNVKKGFFSSLYSTDYNFEGIHLLSDEVFLNNLKKQYVSRVINFDKGQEEFFNQSLFNLRLNVEEIIKKIKIQDGKKKKHVDFNMQREDYLKKVKKKRFDQNHVIKIQHDYGKFNIHTSLGEKYALSVLEMSKLLSKNKYKEKRFILLANDFQMLNNDDLETYELPNSTGGNVIFTEGTEIEIHDAKNVITITQLKKDDWVLIKNADLSNWEINFNGVVPLEYSQNLSQRFNYYGMTGCLNLFNSVLFNTSIHVDGSECEDSLNIINSTGSISNLSVSNSYADAIDFDFSDLEVANLRIMNAGNDCLDVSGGIYVVASAVLKNCFDKGISIGESSIFTAKNIEVENANIAISVKDLSRASIDNLIGDKINFCYEALQKKQEFGGGYLELNNLSCRGEKLVDENSIAL